MRVVMVLSSADPPPIIGLKVSVRQTVGNDRLVGSRFLALADEVFERAKS